MFKKYLACTLTLTSLVITGVSVPLQQAESVKPASATATKVTRPRSRARSAKASAVRRATATSTAATVSDSASESSMESGVIAGDTSNTTLDCGEANLSGLGEFAVEGDKFVIRQGSTVKTGIISTHQTGSYTAVAMHLLEEPKTLSFQLVKGPTGVYSLEAIPGLGGNCRIQNIGIRWPPRRPR